MPGGNSMRKRFGTFVLNVLLFGFVNGLLVFLAAPVLVSLHVGPDWLVELGIELCNEWHDIYTEIKEYLYGETK
jgi:hypothetical protein